MLQNKDEGWYWGTSQHQLIRLSLKGRAHIPSDKSAAVGKKGVGCTGESRGRGNRKNQRCLWETQQLFLWNFKGQQSFTTECQICLTQASVKRGLMTDCVPPSEFQAHHRIPQHFSMKYTILNLLSILRSNSGDPRLCFHTRLKPGWDPRLLKDPMLPSKSTMFFSSHPSCLFCPSPRSLELNLGPQYYHRKQGEQRLEILGFDLAFFSLLRLHCL